MTKLLFLSVFLLLSCVSEEKKTDDGVGRSLVFQPITNAEDNRNAKIICDALANREGRLSSLSLAGATYTFSVLRRDCGQGSFQAPKDVNSRITRLGGAYYFQNPTGEIIPFHELDTSSTGSMGEICDFGGTLESPIRNGVNSALWWRVGSSDECRPSSDTLCVHLQTGSSSDGSTYKIHTNEWIKFKVSGDKEGFFLERTLASSAGCDGKRTFEIQSKLK